MSIEVANESGVAVDESALASVARHVLDAMRVNPAAELSIMVVTTEVMTELHERWMDEPGPDRRHGVPDGRAGRRVTSARRTRDRPGAAR